MSDVQKLIAEARARALTAQGVKTAPDELGLNTQLLIRLADALDAATSPVEPEPAAVDPAKLVAEAWEKYFEQHGMTVNHEIYEPGGWRHNGRYSSTWSVTGWVPNNLFEVLARLAIETLALPDSLAPSVHDDREASVSALVDALGDFPDGETLDPNRSYLTQEAECAADAVLAAGFSRPTVGAFSSGGPADTILAAWGQYFESSGLATEWTRASRPEYTTGRPRATWSVVGRPPVDMLSVLARLAEDTLSRPVGGETETEYGAMAIGRGDVTTWAGNRGGADALVIRWPEVFQLVKRQVTAWLPVSPEQDGGKR
ncbi:hypothetical protein [Mycetocola spongiae]|uniref:hypothetical protein n=1 Tax=Mycetocola spongiae TaxID=2859226 RepID=UPI001CF4E9AD|nr:hypothetical protein [Mycetocola spongiae]UCR89264.1 hypothetical protein KXZ72_00680 [Mycetocola spongiae]